METRALEVGNESTDLRVGMIREACKCGLEARNEPALIARLGRPVLGPRFFADRFGVPWNRTGCDFQVKAPLLGPVPTLIKDTVALCLPIPSQPERRHNPDSVKGAVQQFDTVERMPGTGPKWVIGCQELPKRLKPPGTASTAVAVTVSAPRNPRSPVTRRRMDREFLARSRTS